MASLAISRTTLPGAVWNVVVALAYFGSAKLGLTLAFATESVTAIWPPTGIALVALVLGGWRLVPGVALGAFFANVTTDVPLYTTLGITTGNTLEAVVGAYLLGRAGFDPALRRLRDLFALFLLAGVISTTVSATIGVASLSLGDARADDVLSVWRVWWLGDMGGDLLVAPLLFIAATHWPYREAPGRPLEALALCAALVGTSMLVFSQDASLAYLVFPFLIWAALRFWQPGAASAVLVVAAFAVAYTANEHGQFVEPSKDDSLLLAQTFSAVVGGTVLILATAVSQRRRAEQATRDLAHTLQAALLPPKVPEIPRMDTAAWYRPGTRDQEVGGDFYDVFQTAPDQWAAAIGDVCGKGAEAASLTALARYTLRAVAQTTHQPSTVLRRLNDAIIEQRSDSRFITVAYARVSTRPSGHDVTVSNGGHPLPLLVRRDGEVVEVGESGHLLGILPEPHLADHEIAMSQGDTLLLFTDGLVEDRTGTDGRGVWLRELLRGCAGASAEEIAVRLQREALARQGSHRDDIALLVLRSGTAS